MHGVRSEPMVTLRPARADDEERLLTWRNDPSTRAASFTSEVISAADHGRWFARKLRDPACALLIVEEGGRPVGQVRLDRLDPNLVEISIGLAREARGHGLGREALRLAVSEASGLFAVKTIRAMVKPGNDASLRAFNAAGFRIVREDDDAVELLCESHGDPPPS
jgi:UDP-2,4-diacetamido-2,4,6-trideoxy-beta-L-altropyranose hydrolase